MHIEQVEEYSTAYRSWAISWLTIAFPGFELSDAPLDIGRGFLGNLAWVGDKELCERFLPSRGVASVLNTADVSD